jgi:hypothetical protein
MIMPWGQSQQTQKSPQQAGFSCRERNSLLDLGFLVDHMLANDRIILFDFHFIGHVALVFGRGIEMTSIGAGNEFDFVTHGLLL